MESKDSKSSIAKEQQVLEAMEEFLIQGISGVYMANIRLKPNVKFDKAAMLCSYCTYLNGCWHDYHKKRDAYVIKTINNILKIQAIKDTICLFFWFKNIAEIIFSLVDDDKIKITANGIKSLDLIRLLIHAEIRSVYKVYKELSIMTQFKIKCTGCQEKYDGTDFFLFKEKPQ